MLRNRFLRRRVLSTSSFDPAAWVSKHSVPTKPSAIRNVLHEYSQLYRNDQLNVQKLSSESIRRSLQLLSMLQNKTNKVDIFHHIANHANSKIFAELVETFLLHLLAEDNLNAVTSLVHVVYECDSIHYKLSNQFWSMLASKATLLGHHAACSLVYHEIINPHQAYKKAGVKSLENEFVPFLLLPTAIGQLAIVFAQNGNIAAIEGLRDYFRRFYSYFGHRSTYQTLTIARVECLARSGDFLTALRAFVDLCLKYRGHTRYRDPKDAARSLKYLSYRGYKERQRNITKNIGVSDAKLESRHQQIANSKKSRLFQPLIQYNVYHRADSPHWSIFDGSLYISDLPNFHELLREIIQKLISERSSVIDRLISFISSHHHALHRFVVVSLCDLGQVEVAWSVMNRLPDLYPLVRQKVLFSGLDVFCSLFRALKRAYQGKSSADGRTTKDLDFILSQVYSICQKLHKSTTSYHLSYLEALLASPNVSHQQVESLLQIWEQQGSKRISLDAQSYQRLLSLGLNDSYVTQTYPIHF